jgi:hypothetical protein
MHTISNVNTPFHIDLNWWSEHGRNLGRFLAEIVGAESDARTSEAPVDFIHPRTGEVRQIDPLWVRVLIERAYQPDYITPSTPLTNALLRALLENVNEPMTPVELHRRLNRSNPATLLRVLKATRSEYGIVPVEGAAGR